MSAKRRESTRTASYERNADAIRARRGEKAKRTKDRKQWRDLGPLLRASNRLGHWNRPAKGSKGTKRKRKRARRRIEQRITKRWGKS